MNYDPPIAMLHLDDPGLPKEEFLCLRVTEGEGPILPQQPLLQVSISRQALLEAGAINFAVDSENQDRVKVQAGSQGIQDSTLSIQLAVEDR